MTQLNRRLGLALVLVATISLAVPAMARIITPDRTTSEALFRCTVVLADGWELADVAATWFADEGVLVIERTDGARRSLRPEDLAGLRDAAGRDITREILPAWAVDRLGGDMPPVAPRPQPSPHPEPVPDPPATWPVIDDPAPADTWQEIGSAGPRNPRAPTQDPRVVFSLETGYSAPHDGHFGNYDGGIGFEGVLRMQIAGPLYFSGGYLFQTLRNPGYYDWPMGAPVQDDDCCGYPYYSIDDDGEIRGPWAGISLISTARSPRPVRFYLEGGLGRFTVDGMPVWGWDDAYLGYRMGAGFMFPVGDQATFDLGFRALHLPNLDFGWSPDDGQTMIGINVGLSLLGF